MGNITDSTMTQAILLTPYRWFSCRFADVGDPSPVYAQTAAQAAEMFMGADEVTLLARGGSASVIVEDEAFGRRYYFSMIGRQPVVWKAIMEQRETVDNS